MSESNDPRGFPDPAAAPAEFASLHALAARSQAAATRDRATELDADIRATLMAFLAPGQGDRLAAVFATAPSVATYRHLWRLLAQCEQETSLAGTLNVTVFALPIVIVAGIETDGAAPTSLPGVLPGAKALAGLLREHRALSGNQSFALANGLVAAGALDLAQLPDLLATRALPEAASATRALEPAPIVLSVGPETVHLRFLLGSALAAPGADVLRDASVGKWGLPFAQALGRELAAPGVSVLALPRAPQSLLHAVHAGRAAQREVGAHIFAANAIRKLRASVGEPTAVISAHRTNAAVNGGELRLSLSSPFDPREAEGFRCPIYPLENVAEVVAMLTDFLGECRVSDVRVLPGIHGDRDPATGVPLLFKGDGLQASVPAVH